MSQTDETGNFGDWIEALDVDSLNRAPPEQTVKPVTRFYVRRKPEPSEPDAGKYYKEIHLMQRTLDEFVTRITSKWNVDSNCVTRVVRTLQSGLEVEMDDDAIQQLAEGQDITLEIVELHISLEQSVSRERHTRLDDAPSDEVEAPAQMLQQNGYELRLTF